MSRHVILEKKGHRIKRANNPKTLGYAKDNGWKVVDKENLSTKQAKKLAKSEGKELIEVKKDEVVPQKGKEKEDEKEVVNG